MLIKAQAGEAVIITPFGKKKGECVDVAATADRRHVDIATTVRDRRL